MLFGVEVFTLSSGVWTEIPTSKWPRKSIKLNGTTNVFIDDRPTKELNKRAIRISKLRESLVVYGCIMAEGALCCGVWVMEHDSSFTKLFTIGANVGSLGRAVNLYLKLIRTMESLPPRLMFTTPVHNKSRILGLLKQMAHSSLALTTNRCCYLITRIYKYIHKDEGHIPSITSLKCVLTQEHLNAICAKYFVPEEVHPQLPSPDAAMHERPTCKVGMYTRFFDYANYRIPFSTFFVSVLTHFRIPFFQLSVFGSAKFVVPANAQFSWFSGSNIVKDRAPAPSEYNMEHVNTLIAQASPFLRFLEEFLCWVGISRNYLLNKDTYPRFEYEDGEEMNLNAFIRTADPRKVRIVERPIVTVAKHRTVTLLPNSVGFDSVAGQDNVELTVPVTEHVEAEILRPKRSKKKRVTYDSEGLPVASHPPKRLRADYGTTGGSATGGKSPSVLNRLLKDSRLSVEQGVPALPTLPFITSSVTASPLEEGGDRTDSVTGPSLRTIGPSARFVVLSDSSHCNNPYF
ncbi:hypothetical protein Tco_0421235 [Tanacetum coccineum]